jgi:hypothetical protein
VNPGQYQIAVDREGFISQEYGQRTWNGRGTPITLASGQRVAALAVQLVPTGTIAGKIVDERGDAVPRVQVQALTYQYQNGVRTLVTSRQEMTNDLGEYRLYWLTPGDYYISASPNTGGFGPGGPGGPRGGPPQPAATATSNSSSEESYAATYYPGGTDPETAVSVRVPAAQELRGLDFVLRPVHTVRVKGKITVPDILPALTTQTPVQQNAQAQPQNGRGGGVAALAAPAVLDSVLVEEMRRSCLRALAQQPTQEFAAVRVEEEAAEDPVAVQVDEAVPAVRRLGDCVCESGCTFEIQNVVPGSYNLTSFQPTQNQLLSARMRVEVGYGNVDNVNLTLRPGVDISGKVTVEDSKAPQQFQMTRLRVLLDAPEDLPMITGSQAQVNEDGTFVLKDVAAMSYRLMLNGISNAGYVVTGRYGNADAFGELIQVETDRNIPLSVQLGFSAGSVKGIVSDSRNQAFQAATCVLIPASRGRIDLYKTATSDQNGEFTFANTPPGEYKLLAWEDIPAGAYLDAAFLKQYEGQAQAVTVSKGSPTTAQLRVIPASTQ